MVVHFTNVPRHIGAPQTTEGLIEWVSALRSITSWNGNPWGMRLTGPWKLVGNCEMGRNPPRPIRIVPDGV